MTAAPTCGAACQTGLDRRSSRCSRASTTASAVDVLSRRTDADGEDVHLPGAAQRIGPTATPSPLATEQVEGDVGGVQVGHHQQVGLAVEGRVGVQASRISATGPSPRASRRRTAAPGPSGAGCRGPRASSGTSCCGRCRSWSGTAGPPSARCRSGASRRPPSGRSRRFPRRWASRSRRCRRSPARAGAGRMFIEATGWRRASGR